MRATFATLIAGLARTGAVLVLAGVLAACQGPLGYRYHGQRPGAAVDYTALLARAPEVALEGDDLVRSERFALDPQGGNVIGQLQALTTRYEDTLPDIARRYGLGYEEIGRANPGVDPWLPGEGTRLILPTQFILPDAPREGIVINLATMRLFYYPKAQPNEPTVVVTHPIGIGREGWATPTGRTRVVGKVKNPTWTVPASIRREHAQRGDPLPAQVPPGPDNPLGKFAFRLALPRYLIHGTNKPYGIGMRVSHGCLQLYPEDMAALYPQVPVGTPIHIVNQPVLVGWLGDTLYLEAHAPLEDDQRDWIVGLTEKILDALIGEDGSSAAEVDWDRVAQVAADSRGVPVPISKDSPAGFWETLTAAQPIRNILAGRERGEARSP